MSFSHGPLRGHPVSAPGRFGAAAVLVGAAAAALLPAQAAVLFDNGPAVIGGFSIVPPGNARTGFAIQSLLDNRVADDFVVAPGGWTVESIDFFAYINNATTFDFQAVSWSILAGATPNAATVVASGTTTPTSGGIVGYRVTPTQTANQTRAIWRVQADIPDVTLAAGTHWLAWSMLAADFTLGPWQPGTADGRDGNMWASYGGAPFVTAPDPFSGQQSDLPFLLHGTVGAVPEVPTPWLLALGVAALAARRRRAR